MYLIQQPTKMFLSSSWFFPPPSSMVVIALDPIISKNEFSWSNHGCILKIYKNVYHMAYLKCENREQPQ